MKKHDVIAKYNLPAEVKFCKRCTISNQRPRITFDEAGVCSACNFADHKKSFDWDTRERELVDLLDKHRRTDGSYDVIVPCSGGKDGSFVAHQLKFKYNMNPLCVTWSPNIYTDIGWVNLRNFIDSGFDHVLGTPNGRVNRELTRLALLHIGDPFQPFIYGQTNYPLQMAVKHGVQLIFYGENGEVEYGGDMKNAFRPTREITDHDKHYFSGMPPEFWQDHGLSLADLHPYRAPDYAKIMDNKTEVHFLGYYKMWDPQENFYYCQKNTGFTTNAERSEGTYSKYASLDDKLDGFHYYLAYIKFGIGRCTSDAAHEIRDGKITREEGIALIKRFDGEFPSRHFKVLLDYCNITEDQFWESIDLWRSDHLWAKDGNDWKLRHPIWDEA
ncbi:N-acetyl sugar amidotransferase [bacterium SCSIO 12827]|nr:N-acetyl sugar amidotransferase [bacterium SCSIO 12827]